MRRSRGGLRLASNSHCTSACPEQHYLCMKPMMALGARHTGSTVPFTSAGSAHQHRRATRQRSSMPTQALFGGLLSAKPEQRTATKQQVCFYHDWHPPHPPPVFGILQPTSNVTVACLTLNEHARCSCVSVCDYNGTVESSEVKQASAV